MNLPYVFAGADSVAVFDGQRGKPNPFGILFHVTPIVGMGKPLETLLEADQRIAKFF